MFDLLNSEVAVIPH